MKQTLCALLCLCVGFVSCDTKPKAAEKAAENTVATAPKSAEATPAPTATPTTSPAALPDFAIKYIGKQGFFINGKLVGDKMDEKSIAAAMTAYAKLGGKIPADLRLEIERDAKTDAPLMGETGELRSTVADALKLFTSTSAVASPSATRELPKKGEGFEAYITRTSGKLVSKDTKKPANDANAFEYNHSVYADGTDLIYRAAEGGPSTDVVFAADKMTMDNALAIVKVLAADVPAVAKNLKMKGDAAKGDVTYGNEQQEWRITKGKDGKVKIKFSFAD